MINVFQKGEAVSIYWEIQNWEDTYISPSQGAKITIWQPDGTKAKDYDDSDLEDKPMSTDETGKYYFHYLSRTTDSSGWWSVLCVGTDGTGATAKVAREFGSFELQ